MKNKSLFHLKIVTALIAVCLPTKGTAATHSKSKQESWAPKPFNDPDHISVAMSGVLDFLRNDIYHQGTQPGVTYRPWFTASTAAWFGHQLGYGLFSRKFEEGTTRVTETSSHGGYADRHILPYLENSWHLREEDDAMAAFLFMNAYNEALENVMATQENLINLKAKLIKEGDPNAELIPTVNWVAYDYSGGRRVIKIVDPQIARVVLDPQKMLDKLLIAQPASPSFHKEKEDDEDNKLLFGQEAAPITSEVGEHSRSAYYVKKINLLIEKQSGPAVKYIDPNLIMNLRHETDSKKAYALKSGVEQQLVSTLSDRITKELMAPVKDSSLDVDPGKNESDAPYVDLALDQCLMTTYDNLISKRKNSDVSTEAFLAELNDYADNCYNIYDQGEHKIPQTLRSQVTYGKIKRHVILQQIPMLRAKALEGQTYDTSMKFEADILHAIIGHGLEEQTATDFFKINEEDATADNPYNPLNANFWTQNRETGALLKKFGIGMMFEQCSKIHSIKSETFKNFENFAYTNCPAITFDKTFMAHSSEFLSNPEAVASVYDIMTSSGLNQRGALEFKNLLLAIEFQRRVDHAKALSDGSTKEPYESHPIFDVSHEKDKPVGLGFTVGTMVCHKKPPYALSKKYPCSDAVPDSGFVSTLSNALAGTGSMKIEEVMPSKDPKKPATSAVSGGFRSDPQLRDPLLVGANVFVLANTQPNKGDLPPVNVFDEIDYNTQVRREFDEIEHLTKNFKEAATTAASYVNGLATVGVAFGKVMRPLDETVTGQSTNTEANNALTAAGVAFLEGSVEHAERLTQLGINKQFEGIYKTKVVKRTVKNAEGAEEEMSFYESEACHGDKLDPKINLQNSDNHSRNMAVYQRSYTCREQESSTMITDNIKAIEASINRAKSDVLWTAATVATLPIGGVMVLAGKAAVGGTAHAVRGAYLTYRYGRYLEAAPQAVEELIAAKNLIGGSARAITWGQRLKEAAPISRAAFGHGWATSSELTALRTAQFSQAYYQTSKTMGMGVGMMKLFGGVSTGVQHWRGKLNGQGQSAKDAYAQLLVGGHDPSSLGTVAGMMILADNAALGIKNLFLSSYIKKNPSGLLPVERVNLLRNTNAEVALPNVPPVMGILDRALKHKALKMRPQDLAKQPKTIQESVTWYRRMKMSEAELAREPLDVQQLVKLVKLDRHTTKWANHLGADLPLTTYFQWTSWWDRNEANERIYTQVDKIDAAIAEAKRTEDHDSIKKYEAQKQEIEAQLQGDFLGFDFFDIFTDIATSVAFRYARPGDFGSMKTVQANEQAMNAIVNTTLNMPSTRRISVDDDGKIKSIYIVHDAELKSLQKALAAQKSKFERLADPETLQNAPEYIAVTAQKNDDGTYTLITDPRFRGWKVYRFRDYVPASVRKRLDALSRGIEPTEPAASVSSRPEAVVPTPAPTAVGP